MTDKERAAAHSRAYYQRNREKVRERQRAYRQKNAEAISERRKQRYYENLESSRRVAREAYRSKAGLDPSRFQVDEQGCRTKRVRPKVVKLPPTKRVVQVVQPKVPYAISDAWTRAHPNSIIRKKWPTYAAVRKAFS